MGVLQTLAIYHLGFATMLAQVILADRLNLQRRQVMHELSVQVAEAMREIRLRRSLAA